MNTCTAYVLIVVTLCLILYCIYSEYTWNRNVSRNLTSTLEEFKDRIEKVRITSKTVDNPYFQNRIDLLEDKIKRDFKSSYINNVEIKKFRDEIIDLELTAESLIRYNEENRE